jgi:hypothetical protein
VYDWCSLCDQEVEESISGWLKRGCMGDEFDLVSLAWRGVFVGNLLKCMIDRFRIEMAGVRIAGIDMIRFTRSHYRDSTETSLKNCLFKSR